MTTTGRFSRRLSTCMMTISLMNPSGHRSASHGARGSSDHNLRKILAILISHVHYDLCCGVYNPLFSSTLRPSEKPYRSALRSPYGPWIIGYLNLKRTLIRATNCTAAPCRKKMTTLERFDFMNDGFCTWSVSAFNLLHTHCTAFVRRCMYFATEHCIHEELDTEYSKQNRGYVRQLKSIVPVVWFVCS